MSQALSATETALLKRIHIRLWNIAGEARITKGFRLPARAVVHTVGPIYENKKESEPLLAASYRCDVLTDRISCNPSLCASQVVDAVGNAGAGMLHLFAEVCAACLSLDLRNCPRIL